MCAGGIGWMDGFPTHSILPAAEAKPGLLLLYPLLWDKKLCITVPEQIPEVIMGIPKPGCFQGSYASARYCLQASSSCCIAAAPGAPFVSRRSTQVRMLIAS